MAQVRLDVSELSVKLHHPKPPIDLDVDLPFPVLEQDGTARFSKVHRVVLAAPPFRAPHGPKDKRVLEVVLPVKPPPAPSRTVPRPPAPSSSPRQSGGRGELITEVSNASLDVASTGTSDSGVPSDARTGDGEESSNPPSPRCFEDPILQAAYEASKRPLAVMETPTHTTVPDEGDEDEGDAAHPKHDPDFQPCARYDGTRGGFVFKTGRRGLGYYRDGRGSGSGAESEAPTSPEAADSTKAPASPETNHTASHSDRPFRALALGTGGGVFDLE